MSRSDRLVAVYARFADAIADIPDLRARELHQIAADVPRFVDEARMRAPQLTGPQTAEGLEQGLLEMPELMADVSDDWRWALSRALHQALVAECPEFLALDAQRLAGITGRGSIRNDAEFYLVRHRVDVLEGEPELGEELRALYGLVAAYRTRA